MFFGVPINTREVFGVLHIKGFVFDDTVLYSGASINNVYLQQQDKYRLRPISKNPIMLHWLTLWLISSMIIY